jgi:hypothetical protein
MVRAVSTDRKLNRTEISDLSHRPIAPLPPAETTPGPSTATDDTRQPPTSSRLGHARLHLNLIGYAVATNGITLYRHHRHRAPDDLAA